MVYKNGKKGLLMALFLLLIVGLSVGYALYNRNLKINGISAIKDNSWIIYFDNIVKQDGSIEALNSESEATIIDREKTQIRFGINFKNPGEKYEFVVDIVNDGTIDAMIDSVEIKGFEEYSDVFTWNITYLDGTPVRKCDELKAKTRRKVRVVANYGDVSDKSELPSQTKTVDLTFDVHYIQEDDKSCTIIPDTTQKYTISVDPNGGVYKGSSDITIENVEKGEKYNLLEPTRDEYVFDGWTVTPNDVYNTETSIITVGEENITTVAKWREATNNDHTISVDPNGGTYKGSSDITVENVTKGDEYTIDDPEREGYRFISWTVTPNDVYNSETDIITVGDEDIITVANWEEIVKHTLTINPNGGVYNDETSATIVMLESGNTYEVLVPTREEFEFAGWTVSEENVYDNDTNIFTMGDNDVTLTAKWNAVTPKHNVTIDPNGGTYDGNTDVLTFKLGEEETYEVLVPTYDGFEFAGWIVNEENVYNETSKVLTMGSSDITLTAKWNDPDVEEEINKGNVARINKVYYHTIQDAFDDAVEDDVVHMLVSTTESPTNNTTDSITLNLEGFTVTGTMTNNGNLTLLNGELKNEDDYVFVNNGDLKLGQDDGNVVVEQSIQLIGNDNALKQNGTFEFYDGYLLASNALSGGCDAVPTDYYVFIDRLDDKQKIYPTKDNSRAVAKTVKNNITTLYFNLQDAFNVSMDENLEIASIRNFDATYELHIDENKSVDYNVGNFDVNFGNTVTNNGILNITGGNNSFGILTTIVNNGELNLTNLKINRFNTTVSNIDNYGKLNFVNTRLTGGKVSNYSNQDLNFDVNSIVTSLYNSADSNVKLLNGTIKTVENDGILTLENGLISTNISTRGVDVITVDNKGKFIMNGGKILAKTTSTGYDNAYAIRGGDVEINDGTIESYSKNYSAYAVGKTNNVIINGGNILATGISGYGISSFAYEINGGTITVDASSGSGVGLDNGISDVDNRVVNGGSIVVNNNVTAIIIPGIINDANVKSDSLCVSASDEYGRSKYFFVINGGEFHCGQMSVSAIYGEINGGEFYSKGNTVFLKSNRNNGVLFTITGGKFISEEENALKSTNGTVNISAPLDALAEDYPYFEGKKSGFDLSYGSVVLNVDKAIVVGKTEYGILFRTGELTLGKNEKSIDTMYPHVIGETYGLYRDDYTWNDPTRLLKIYDGRLEGKTDGHFDYIDALADGAQLVKQVNDDVTIEYQQEIANFARIGENEYYSLNDAFADIVDTGTVEIIRDVTIFSEVEVPSDKNITIDLKGHNLQLETSITNNGNLTIIDSEGDGVLIGKFIKFIVNNGNMYVDGAKLSIVDNYMYSNGNIEAVNSGNIEFLGNNPSIIFNNKNLTINNGKISGDVGAGEFYTLMSGINLLTFTDSEVDLVGDLYSIFSAKTINMNGGTINATVKDISSYNDTEYQNQYLISANNYNINNLTINGEFSEDDKIYVVLYNGGNSQISNSTINSTSSCFKGYQSTLTIENGNYVCGRYGYIQDYYNGSSSIIINGANIQSVLDVIYDKAKTMNATINSGTLVSTDGNGINLNEGNVSVGLDTSKSSIIKAKENAVQVLKSGSITVGVDDESISNSSPVIRGNNYGLYFEEPVNVYVYDGLIESLGKTYNNFVTGTPNGYTLKDRKDDIDGTLYKVSYLDELGDFLRIGDTTYSSFADAISVAGENDIIELLYSVMLTTPIEIPTNKVINISLNGNTLGLMQPITNNGILTFDDVSGDEGSIITSVDDVIYNLSTLNIKNGIFNGKNRLIRNKSVVNIEGGTFNTESDKDTMDTAVVYSEGSSSIIDIKNSNLNVKFSGSSRKAYGIYGGTISVSNSKFDIQSEKTDSIAIFDQYGLTVNNTVINNAKDAILSNNNYETVINGGTVNVTGVCVNARNVTITGGNYTCGGRGFYIANALLSDANVVSNDVTLYISNTTVLSGKYVSLENNGVYNNGTVNIFGQEGNGVNTNSPEIVGALYGIFNYDKVENYMYDGVIKGKTASVLGEFNDIERDYSLYTEKQKDENDEDIYVSYLVYNDLLVENVNTESKYHSLQSALDEVNPDEELRLLSDCKVFNDIEISSLMNVTMDLNGHTLEFFRNIKNDGVLNIVDRTNNKSQIIMNYSELQNNGTLNMNGIDYYASDLLTSYNNGVSKIIYNSGVLNISDSKVTFETGEFFLQKGTINVDNSELYSNKYEIFYLDKGNLNINNNSVLESYSSTLDSSFNKQVSVVINDSSIKSDSYCFGIFNSALTLKAKNIVTDCAYSINGYYNTVEIEDSNLKGAIYDRESYSNTIIKNSVIDGFIVSNGTMTLDSDTINLSYDSSTYTLINKTGQTLVMNDCNITLSRDENLESNLNGDVAVIGVKDGLLQLSNNIITINSNSSSRENLYGIKATTSRNYNNVVYGNITSDNDTFIINGGVKDYAYYMNIDNYSSIKNADIRIKGIEGTPLTNAYGIYDDPYFNNDSTLELKNSKIDIQFSRTSYGMYIDGVTVDSEDNEINVINDCTSNYNYTTFNGYGIYIKNGSFTSPTLKLNMRNTNTASYSWLYGIYSLSSSVTLGTYDGVGDESADINVTNPYIEVMGGATAIPIYKSDGSLKVYDGYYKGQSGTFDGTINELEKNYFAVEYYDQANNYFYNQFEYMLSPSTAVVKVNDNLYTSIALAMKKNSYGTLILLKDIEDDIRISDNIYSITLDLNGYTYDGKITIDQGKELTIKNGTIRNDDDVAIENNGTLNIGVNDSEMLPENVIVTSGDTAIVGNGIINIYDGIVRGISNATTNIIGKVPNGYGVVNKDKNVLGVIYKSVYLDEVEPSFEVNGQEYDVFTDAVNAIDEEGTIKLINSSGRINSYLNIPQNKSITLDLNGNILTVINQIYNNGILNIIDNSESKNGKIVGVYSSYLTNNGTLNIENVELYGIDSIINSYSGANTYLSIKDVKMIINVTTNNTVYGVQTYSLSQIDGLDVEIKGSGTSSVYGVCNYYSPSSAEQSSKTNIFENVTVNVTGNFTNSIYGIYSGYGPILTINHLDVDIDSSGYAYGVSGSSLVITDFDLNIKSIGSVYGINCNTVQATSGKIKVTGESGVYGIQANGSKMEDVEIDVSTVNNSSYGVNGSGNQLINSKVKSNSDNSYSYGTYGSGNQLINSSISSNSDNSYSYGASGSTIIVNNTEIKTIGLNVYGLQGSSINVTSSDLYVRSTKGQAYGIMASGEQLVFVDSTLETRSDKWEDYSTQAFAITSSCTQTYVVNSEIISDDFGIMLSSGTLNLPGNKINAGMFGVYSSNAESVIKIGSKDQTYNEIPVIVGGISGISSSGGVYFYDGIIKGKTSAIGADISEVEDEMDVITDTEIIDGEEYIVNYLQ